MMRTDFLPKKGLIYVDTCAPQWVCSDMDVGDRVKSLERMRSFRNVFKKRGNISTTPRVLREIGHSMNHYKSMKDRMVREKKVARREGHNVLFSLDDMHEAERFYKVYDAIYRLLEDGMKRYSPRNVVSPEDVRLFTYNGDDELSKADKELVCTALVAGNGHGILSADTPLLKKYREGAREFHLPGAFICDAMRGMTYPAMGW